MVAQEVGSLPPPWEIYTEILPSDLGLAQGAVLPCWGVNQQVRGLSIFVFLSSNNTVV